MYYFQLFLNLSLIEQLFAFTILLCSFFYLHFFLTYFWNIKQLSLLNKKENYNIMGFSFWGMLTCFSTLAPFFIDKDNHLFTINLILFLTSIVTAKSYYFKSLRKLLKLPRFDRIYKYLVYIYIGIAIILFVQSFYSLNETLFNITAPTNSNSLLRNLLIPYEGKSYIKILFLPNFIFCFIAYIYLIYKSILRKEYFISCGVFFSFIALIYTNSYHLIHLKYWMPLNVIADIFELFRLNMAQKSIIKNNIKNNLQKMEQIEQKYENLLTEHKTFKHDLANNFTHSQLNLLRAHKLLTGEEEKPHEVLKSIKRALDAQYMANELFQGSNKIVEINLQQHFEKLSDIFNIKINLVDSPIYKFKFHSVDFNNILVNLIKNAKEANEANQILNEPWINVIYHYNDKKKTSSFKVIDSGLIKNINHQEQIFDKGISTKGKDQELCGLGLYSVSKIIQKYNGEIKLESFKGNTCFSFTLSHPSIKDTF